MTIGIDGNEANVEQKVGVSVYTLNLLRYFHSKATPALRFIVYLKYTPSDVLPKQSPYFTYKVIHGPMFWSQLFLPIHLWFYKLMGGRLDVFFSPAHYIPRLSPFKTVVTIHDLSYLYFPGEFLKKDLYQLRNWTQYALKNAVKIIAVSDTTKKDIVKEYMVQEKKITVIHNGYNAFSTTKLSTSHYPPFDFAQGKLSTTSYFLSVGTIQPRKNLSMLISSFALFHKNHPTYKLLLAGKKGWLYEDIFKQVVKMKMDKAVTFLGYVSDEEKINLFNNATAFILPSLYEGFGIPLLEAMSYGCPVISSNSSSLPEVGGNACLYFDPRNTTELVEKMELIISDKSVVNDLVTKGGEQIKSFSWEETGKQTLNVLVAIANNG